MLYGNAEHLVDSVMGLCLVVRAGGLGFVRNSSAGAYVASVCHIGDLGWMSTSYGVDVNASGGEESATYS